MPANMSWLAAWSAYDPAAVAITGGTAVLSTETLNTDRGMTFSNQTSSAGASAGTLSNAPAAGNPTFYLKAVVNGVNVAIPCWPG